MPAIKRSMLVQSGIMCNDRNEWGYRVLRVTNSTDIAPMKVLTKTEINALIENGWTVSIQAKM